jgi:hypothetical protein
VIATLLSIACGFVLGLAQPVSTTDFPTLVERLDDDAWLTRESATQSIATDDSIPLDAIAGALGRDDLSTEQRTRLWQAALNRFRMEPKGGLGVSFQPGGEGGVRIGETIAGFPAAELLRAGDTVVSVEGRYVSGQNELRAEILSRRPGEVMGVLVRRDREVLELALPLGAYSELTGAAMLDEPTAAWALRLRLERAGAAAERIDGIGDGLGATAWIGAAFPEGGVLPIEERGERADPSVVVPGSGTVRGRGRISFWPGPDEAMKDAGEAFRALIGRLMTERVRLRSVMVEFERSLTIAIRDGEANGEDVSSLEARLAALRERMREMDEALGETARRMDQPLP